MKSVTSTARRARREKRTQQWLLWIGSTAVGAALCATADAQSPTVIKTDASWARTPAALAPVASGVLLSGNAGATHAVPGNVYVIPQSLGRTAGSNLFHSFESFGVGSGDAAVFTTASKLNNVISRISGSSPSAINGLLELLPAAGTRPNLFFINPNGITFGAGAQVDVPAALHVSTANHLRFLDGTVFAAGTGADSTLTIAPPAAFGFLGTTRAPVQVSDGTILLTRPGNPLTITAGDILVDNGALATGAATLSLAAIGQQSVEVPLGGVLPLGLGDLTLRNGAEVLSFNIGAFSGGDVRVSAGNMTIDGGGQLTGIFTVTDDAGKAGDVFATVANTLTILNQGQITTKTFAKGDAGSIKIEAGSIVLDRAGSAHFTGIGSETDPGSEGNAGAIDIATDALTMKRGAQINTSTFAAGRAGSINVTARTVLIDGMGSIFATGIGSQAEGVDGGDADAGSVTVKVADTLAILNGGSIAASTFSARNGGVLHVDAGDLVLLGDDGPQNTGIFSNTEGSGRGGDVAVHAAHDILILLGAEVSSGTFASGSAGSVKVSSERLLIDGAGSVFFTGISSSANTASKGNAGSVDVAVGDIVVIRGGGEVTSSTFGAGNAGSVKIAARSLSIDGAGSPLFTGVASDAGYQGAGSIGNNSVGNAGSIDIDVTETLSILNGGEIATSTFSFGRGGLIAIQAGSLLLDRDGSSSVTGIFSNAMGAGHAGDLAIDIDGDVHILRGATISSSTFATADAGSIKLGSRNLFIDGSGPTTGIISQAEPSSHGSAGSVEVTVAGELQLVRGAEINTNSLSSGDAGSVTVKAGSALIDGSDGLLFTGIGSFAARTGAPANAGSITVAVDGALTVRSGGSISSDSSSGGSAGSVSVAAGDILLDGSAQRILTAISSDALGTGAAGSVTVHARGDIRIEQGAKISSDTQSDLGAGTVAVSADRIVISGINAGIASAISSDTLFGAGRGGDVQVQAAHALQVLDGGEISASTSSSGAAGAIKVRATDVLVDGSASKIVAAASQDSSGQTGSVDIAATNTITLSNGGTLSIRNDADVADPTQSTPALLSVTARTIMLKDASITAQSSGNVAASDIRIGFSDRLMLDPSSITTSARFGDGGDIRIDGGNLLVLDRSQITTSVSPGSGNGGDISIHARTLVLQTGFIQANTTGAGASGGNVLIDVQSLVPSGSTLAVGGTVPAIFNPDAFQLNVIQAAAPTGISGAVNVTAPALDIAGSLRGLSTEVVSSGALGKDLCRVGASSSLTPLGRGGLRATASGMIRPESIRFVGNLGGEAAEDRVRPAQVSVAMRQRCEQ